MLDLLSRQFETTKTQSHANFAVVDVETTGLADPNSLSGKAKKARQHGTRLMSDRVFWQALGVPVD